MVSKKQLHPENIWEQKFASTSEEQFKRLAEQAKEEESISLDEFLNEK